MMTIGFFASAEIGATASAFGVSPKPAMMFLVCLYTDVELLAVVGERTRELRDHADLDGLLRQHRRGDKRHPRCRHDNYDNSAQHVIAPF
jgi:hypothetical protein